MEVDRAHTKETHEQHRKTNAFMDPTRKTKKRTTEDYMEKSIDNELKTKETKLELYRSTS